MGNRVGSHPGRLSLFGENLTGVDQLIRVQIDLGNVYIRTLFFPFFFFNPAAFQPITDYCWCWLFSISTQPAELLQHIMPLTLHRNDPRAICQKYLLSLTSLT